MIHLSKEGGTVGNVTVPYINKAYEQTPVATCYTLSILGHGSRQRKQHSDAVDKVVIWTGRRWREIWRRGPRRYGAPCRHGESGAKMQIRKQLLVPSVRRQASSSHGQCVGNSSADQNSSAPRLLTLTLNKSPEPGHGEARPPRKAPWGQRRVTLPTEETTGTTSLPPWSHIVGGVEEGCRRMTAFDCHRYTFVETNSTEVLICFDRRRSSQLTRLNPVARVILLSRCRCRSYLKINGRRTCL